MLWWCSIVSIVVASFAGIPSPIKMECSQKPCVEGWLFLYILYQHDDPDRNMLLIKGEQAHGRQRVARQALTFAEMQVHTRTIFLG